MSDTTDIVTRLRMRPTIVRKNQFGSLETDRAATKLFDDVHALMREAADEIARLSALWCEEKSKSMTFYAEIERLRAELVALKANDLVRNLEDAASPRDEGER